jgi:hypothetical protein
MIRRPASSGTKAAGDGRAARSVRGSTETVPFGEAPGPQDAGPTEPDILDMFGVPPVKPEGKEAK